MHTKGVAEVVRLEKETAERKAKKITLKRDVDSYELSDDYSIVEVKLPVRYEGQSLNESKIRDQYHLLILTMISKEEVSSVIGKSRKIEKVHGVATATDVLHKDDILVVYGAN